MSDAARAKAREIMRMLGLPVFRDSVESREAHLIDILDAYFAETMASVMAERDAMKAYILQSGGDKGLLGWIAEHGVNTVERLRRVADAAREHRREDGGCRILHHEIDDAIKSWFVLNVGRHQTGDAMSDAAQALVDRLIGADHWTWVRQIDAFADQRAAEQTAALRAENSRLRKFLNEASCSLFNTGIPECRKVSSKIDAVLLAAPEVTP